MTTLFCNSQKPPAPRDTVTREAMSWRGTPYILKGRVKGAGADCFTFPAEVMIACGLFTRNALPPYQHDWFLHQTEEQYLKLLFKHAAEVLTAVCWPTLKVEPGNIVVVRAVGSKVFNHSAIVLDWPRCIHCVKDGGVQDFRIDRHPMWAVHEVKIFDPFLESLEQRLLDAR
jgi:cell wall-associated NlpC family hydrolase